MLFHLDFRVEYSAEMSQNDLFDIWSEEATAPLVPKRLGLWLIYGRPLEIAG